jgi:uncharacterized membrane protein (UPF0127 family)
MESLGSIAAGVSLGSCDFLPAAGFNVGCRRFLQASSVQVLDAFAASMTARPPIARTPTFGSACLSRRKSASLQLRTTGRGLSVKLRLALSLLVCSAAQAQPSIPQPPLPTTRLQAGMHVIEAEVADTDTTRAIGLMARQSMAEQRGMLFVFERAGKQCFWMQNTLLPLSIAFIADDGAIVNIADMKPMTTDSHCSAKPVRFALEMNQGWFARRGIGAGFKLSGEPFKPAPPPEPRKGAAPTPAKPASAAR